VDGETIVVGLAQACLEDRRRFSDGSQYLTPKAYVGGRAMSNHGERRPLRISVEEAKERYDENEVTVVDVVDPHTHERLSQQIKGAIRIDPREVSDHLAQVPEDRAVLAY
jgi:hypothetical protein